MVWARSEGRAAAGPAVALSLIAALVSCVPAGLGAQRPPDEQLEDRRVASDVDSIVQGALTEAAIPGAVVVAVRDGRVVLSEGYGTQGPPRERPMSATGTVLPVGSLAKPVTAAAVLRLAARGGLDMEADVRGAVAALDLPFRHGGPVTLGDLLTHTSGFGDSEFGDAARSPDTALPLERFLERSMAAQAFRPGRFYRYSNHGYALAGYLLQEAAEADFAAHLRDGLLLELGMTRSSFERVPAPDLEKALVTGYREDGEELVPVPLDYSNVIPADGLLTTGRDMSRFLLALTDTAAGRGIGGRVRHGMLTTAFRYHDSLPGVTLAFQERPVQGRSGLEHTGGRLGVTSQLVVLPAERFGLFVALNRRDSRARGRLVERLLDRFLPRSDSAVRLAAEAAPPPVTDGDRLTGVYRSIRYNRRTLEKLAVLLGMVPQVVIEEREGKALRIGGGEFFEVDSLLFRWQEADWYNAFSLAAGGRSHLYSGHQAFEEVRWWEDRDLHRLLIAGAALLLLLVLVLEIVGAMTGRSPPTPSGPDRRYGWVRWLLAGASAALLAGAAILVVALRDLGLTADYGAPPSLRAGLALLLLGALLTVPLPLLAGTAWVRSWWTAPRRILFTMESLAAALLVALLGYWNLIGFRY